MNLILQCLFGLVSCSSFIVSLVSLFRMISNVERMYGLCEEMSCWRCVLRLDAGAIAVLGSF